MQNIKMDGMSLADLVWVSPYVKKRIMHSLRTIPKEKRAMLLKLYPELMLDLEQPKGRLYTFKRVLEMSRYSTHVVKGKLSGTQSVSMLDGGACANCVSLDFVKRANIPVVGRTNNASFRQVNGDQAGIVGEVHDVVLDVNEMVVPFSALVIAQMDGDVLLGRPFLEKVRAKADYEKGRFFFQWQGKLAVVDCTDEGVPIVIQKTALVYVYMEHWDEISAKLDVIFVGVRK